MHGENSKIKVAGWKNKSKAPTQSQNIIDSWAARGLLPSIYTNIYIHTYMKVGGWSGRSPRLSGRFGADTRTWSWKFNDKTKCFCYVSYIPKPHKGRLWIRLDGDGIVAKSGAGVIFIPCTRRIFMFTQMGVAGSRALQGR